MKKIITLLFAVHCFLAKAQFVKTFSDSNTEMVSVAFNDFNGDRIIDLVGTHYSGGAFLRLGNNTGTFGPAAGFNTEAVPVSVVSDDFNKDGKADLAIANYEVHTVSVFIGNGSGGFMLPVHYSAGIYPMHLISEDLNSDGIPDLAVANENMNGSSISVLLGNGSGTFGIARELPLIKGVAPHWIIAGDFNRDGKKDLVTANAASGDISLFAGNGKGDFSEEAIIISGFNVPSSLVSKDFNGDGNTDLAITNFMEDKICVCFSDADGNFNRISNLSVGKNPYSVVTVDFNGDGIADLASADVNSDQVSILIGNGKGDFVVTSHVQIDSPTVLIISDVNGDSKPDIFAANQIPGYRKISKSTSLTK